MSEETRKILSETYWNSPETLKPDTSNEIRFHGIMEEFKKYLPELYEKMKKEEKKND